VSARYNVTVGCRTTVDTKPTHTSHSCDRGGLYVHSLQTRGWQWSLAEWQPGTGYSFIFFFSGTLPWIRRAAFLIVREQLTDRLWSGLPVRRWATQ
jgi:hypothetical protein